MMPQSIKQVHEWSIHNTHNAILLSISSHSVYLGGDRYIMLVLLYLLILVTKWRKKTNFQKPFENLGLAQNGIECRTSWETFTTWKTPGKWCIRYCLVARDLLAKLVRMKVKAVHLIIQIREKKEKKMGISQGKMHLVGKKIILSVPKGIHICKYLCL